MTDQDLSCLNDNRALRIVHRLGELERWPCRDLLVPGCKLRLLLPPGIALEAEVDIGQRDAHRDVADAEGRTLERRRLGLQRLQRLAALDPIAVEMRLGLRGPRQFVPPQQ